MNDWIKLITDTDPRGVYAVNLLLCVLGALWTAGVARSERESISWRGWLGFWIGTGAYYALVLAASKPRTIEFRGEIEAVTFATRLPICIEQLGLYFATWALLISYALVTYHSIQVWKATVVCSLVVAIAAALDTAVLLPSGVHQALTSIAIGQWAWRLRARDQAKSSTMLLYALAQIPIQPVFASLGMNNGGYDNFESASYVIYAVLKLSLIPAICLAVTRAQYAPRIATEPSASGLRVAHCDFNI